MLIQIACPGLVKNAKVTFNINKKNPLITCSASPIYRVPFYHVLSYHSQHGWSDLIWQSEIPALEQLVQISKGPVDWIPVAVPVQTLALHVGAVEQIATKFNKLLKNA